MTVFKSHNSIPMRVMRAGVVFLVCSMLAACPSNPLMKNDLTKLLKDAGWVVLPLPDETVGPGAVIYFPKEKSPSLVQSLEQCGVPKELLTTHSGTAPTIATNANYNISVSASIATMPASASGDLSSAKKATVQVTSHGADVLTNLGGIDSWVQDPANSGTFHPNCVNYFKQPDFFLVYQAWRIKAGTYTFYSDVKGSAKVDVTKMVGTNKVGAAGSAEANKDGTITFTSQTYLAIREVVPTQGGLHFAGSDVHPPVPLENADARLQAAWK
jgi:hypothetical protein